MEGAVLNHETEAIVGESRAINRALREIRMVASTDATVLILGETGTGKELAARAVHKLSPRRDKALVKVNCSAMPSGLIENELFGHERGAYTGAQGRKVGRFELANGGTIFLDEIGDLPLEMQTKLLRVLQEEEFERIGGTETIKVDVRVIAATNLDLGQAMQDGRFRLDLYYRLNVFPVRLPPLRERRDDIPLLAVHLLRKHAASLDRDVDTIRQQTMEILRAHSWPGNVRELENVIERGVIVSRGRELELAGWPPNPGAAARASPFMPLKDMEREHILRGLGLTGWRVSGDLGAAKLLGMKPTTLEARMKKLGIKRSG